MLNNNIITSNLESMKNFFKYIVKIEKYVLYPHAHDIKFSYIDSRHEILNLIN